ncbi:hypothetical protein [Flavobacterium phage FL-1]|nr:hypothetical protein [Flavobacterium phage FL-1]
MAISLIQHSRALTSKVVGSFVEEIKVKSGFNGWFPRETTPTLEVDVEVQRDNDLIAVDVVRFTEGNKNKFSRVTEHKYIPPFFNEQHDFQRDQVYMNSIAMGAGMDNVSINAAIVKSAVKAIRKNRQKIERAIAKQQADVLQTGIVTMVNGDNIDYRRKAASMTVSPLPWSNPTTAKPLDDLRAGLEFLRDTGNSGGSAVNVIMSGQSLAYFLAADQITKQGSNVVKQIERINIVMPQFEGATGFAFHGQVAAGDFVINLWTYAEKYTNDAGQTVKYLVPTNVIMIPDDFEGKTVFGGLYTLNKINGIDMPQIVETDYLIRNYSDEKTVSSTLELTSAPLVIPFTIDKIYTFKAY